MSSQKPGFTQTEISKFNETLKARWLNGEEYLMLLDGHEVYSKHMHLEVFETNHPDQIYFRPTHGQLYYVKTKRGIAGLGFPRLTDKRRKQFVWKRMNFETHLPKSNPVVSYIVASTSYKDQVFRMHIVWKFNEKNEALIVCHVMQNFSDSCKIQDKKEILIQGINLKEVKKVERKVEIISNPKNIKKSVRKPLTIPLQEEKKNKMLKIKKFEEGENIFRGDCYNSRRAK